MCRSEAETNTRISDRTVIPTERSEWRNLQFQYDGRMRTAIPTERSEWRNLQFQYVRWSDSGLRPPLTTTERNDKALAFCEPSLGQKRGMENRSC